MIGLARIWIDEEGMHIEWPKDAHGFMLPDVEDGLHAPKCIDHLCDGCVALDECSICSRPEFEHGDGNE